jgi:lipopolysaccharide/colanic/teichoic acid biosynthesis glycosyltransferase
MKRIFDLLAAAVGLLILALPMALLAWQVRRKLGSPVLFTQVRPGLHGKPFRMIKFRTMTDTRDASGVLLPDAERITPFGRFLRATSLDELPELWNVLRGEMSLVGPRPLLVDYLMKYSPKEMRRHEVLPGITGLAQVRGRNTLSWKNKFRYDVFYVDHCGFLFDLKILMQTISVVIFRSGFKSHGELKRFDE